MSSELDEVMALADQVAVMCQGRIVGVVPPDTSREQIGLLMAGVEQASTTSPSEGDHTGDDTGGGQVSGQERA